MDEQNPDGITAYHGSPHEFEQFDTSKIGTGEGAQAFGHGLYFAEAEPVAEEYKNVLSSIKPRPVMVDNQKYSDPTPMQKLVIKHLGDVDSAYKAMMPKWQEVKNKYMNSIINSDDMEKMLSEIDYNEAISQQKELESMRGKKVALGKAGHMYEVHIDAHPDHFLDWDKPAKDQHPHILNAIAPLFPDGIPETKRYGETFRGGDLYDLMKQRLGGLMYKKLADEAGIPSRLPGGTDERLSKYLISQGIHGIKYFDQGSRDRGGGTRNYVVFDHDRVNIKRRYAEGGEVEAYGDGGGVDREKNLAAWHEGSHFATKNRDGSPRVYYHGSNQKLNIIEPNRRDPGAWFTTNLQGAANYARGEDAHVHEVYLKSKNPMVVPFNYDESGNLHAFHNDKKLPFSDNVSIVKHAQKLGYDGVHFPNGNFSEDDNTFVVFHPHQIKSATGNNGNFDPNDPDITKAEGGVVDRTKMSYKDVTQRVAELKEAAPKLGTDEMTPEMYQDLVNKHKPVQAWDHVPAPATQEEIYNALDANKRRNVGKGHLIPEGYPVGLRLDIPAYTNHGVWVPTIHDRAGSKPTVLAHEPAAHITDAKFNILPNTTDVLKALKIAQGGTKNPFATINGSWNPTHPDDIHAMAQQYLNHPDWAQVGMDPERHSYFYDRRTQQPITHASEVLQVGPLVLAHKPVYGNKEDYPFKDGGVIAKTPAKLHNPAIVEHALAKISAPPPALDPTLMVAKRGRPF